MSKRKLVHVKLMLGLSIENLKSLDNGVSCSCLNLFFSFSHFQTLGKVGRVQQIYHDNDLKVCPPL